MPDTDREMTYVDAGVEALAEEMKRDESIIYIGQGIGARGGTFGRRRGFGNDLVISGCGIRVRELGETGIGIGAAMNGTRAIVDNVFLDFFLEAMTQIIQQAAKIHYCSNGKIKVPLMIRGAMGSLRSAGPQHSHAFYAWFAHVPGLKVVTPSTPYDVKGLMKTALREDSPVIFLEHKALYNTKGLVPTSDYLIPLGQGRVLREGTDLTLVAVSRMVHLALEAAKELEKEGVSAEVIDPRTIVPLDRAIIAESIVKTGRIVFLDEAPAMCGFSGEIFAIACEECFDLLDAPPKRICSLPVPNPFSPVLESAMIPGVSRIVSEIREFMQT